MFVEQWTTLPDPKLGEEIRTIDKPPKKMGTHFRVIEDMQLPIEVLVLAGIMHSDYSTGTKCNIAVNKTKVLASVYTVCSHVIAKATDISLANSAVMSDRHCVMPGLFCFPSGLMF